MMRRWLELLDRHIDRHRQHGSPPSPPDTSPRGNPRSASDVTSDVTQGQLSPLSPASWRVSDGHDSPRPWGKAGNDGEGMGDDGGGAGGGGRADGLLAGPSLRSQV